MSKIPVILIDDDAVDIMLFKKSFSSFENAFQLMTFKSGEHAWDSLATAAIEPVMIFLDLYMPQVSGLDFLTRLRTHTKFQKIPVVLFTSEENDPNVELAKKLGISQIIPKPIVASQIEDILSKHCCN